MSFHTALRAFLVAGVPGVSGRVYWRTLPQTATLPAVVYFMLPGRQQVTFNNDRKQLFDGRWQIECYGESLLDDVLPIEKSVRDLLQGFRGQVGDYRVAGSFLENRLEDTKPATKRQRMILDFMIKHEDD